VHRAALRPGGSATPAHHGVRPPHAQTPHHDNVDANQAGLRAPWTWREAEGSGSS
jgi:hypothetical protein